MFAGSFPNRAEIVRCRAKSSTRWQEIMTGRMEE
jgi:hypothetical protein